MLMIFWPDILTYIYVHNSASLSPAWQNWWGDVGGGGGATPYIQQHGEAWPKDRNTFPGCRYIYKNVGIPKFGLLYTIQKGQETEI